MMWEAHLEAFENIWKMNGTDSLAGVVILATGAIQQMLSFASSFFLLVWFETNLFFADFGKATS